MIIKDVKGSSEKAYYVIPEDADDLFTVQRIIKKKMIKLFLSQAE